MEGFKGDQMAEQVFKLGFGNGSLIDNGDGTASYRNITPEFLVAIADITGFSYTRDADYHLTLKLLGHGTELASARVGKSTARKIEEWFRAHPDFGQRDHDVPDAAPALLDPRLIADELTKLAGLRDAGVLTDTEFATQKARLLG
ncbi:hypothetical protein QF031_002290 [Pseudarthrobacter defluvii]|uniref:SHOCT domain-containing protein n=1 Tax=Pseudarthrobacter defluvii TaxID=410837 RepID=UPI0027874C6A|nr:SHOCT domain-containing protein [Pseudarthrobacter defluvii]MDQ0769541.1 hypothetical protein [Pseudarthrobacter defluvii]